MKEEEKVIYYSEDSVRHLDKVGANGAECRYHLWVEVEGKSPVAIYGTDKLPKGTFAANDLIHHIVMRNYLIDASEAKIISIKDKPLLVIQDLQTLVEATYSYIIIH
jgi:hypothetical protein